MDRAYIWDALRPYQRFFEINKCPGIIIRKIMDGNGNIKQLICFYMVCNSLNLFLLFLSPFYSSTTAHNTKNSYEIRYNAHKHIETTERGLVIVAAHENDAGRYDCHLGGSLLCSYVITVDAHR